jgi:hypothetical protein
MGLHTIVRVDELFGPPRKSKGIFEFWSEKKQLTSHFFFDLSRNSIALSQSRNLRAEIRAIQSIRRNPSENDAPRPLRRDFSSFNHDGSLW